MSDIIQRLDEQIAKTVPGVKIPTAGQMRALLEDAKAEIERLRGQQPKPPEPQDFPTFFESIAHVDRMHPQIKILAAAIGAYYGKAKQ